MASPTLTAANYHERTNSKSSVISASAGSAQPPRSDSASRRPRIASGPQGTLAVQMIQPFAHVANPVVAERTVSPPGVDGEPIGYIYTGPDPASLARKNGPHYYHHDTGCQVPMASPSWVPHWLTMVFRFSGIPTTVWVNEARENPSPGARDSSHPSSAWQDRVGDGKHVKFETGMVPPPNPLFHRLQMPKDIQHTMVAKSAYVEIVTSLDYVSLLYSKWKRGCKRRARGSYVGQVFRVVAGVCGGVGEAIGVVEGIGNRSVKGVGTSSFLAGVDRLTVEREVPQVNYREVPLLPNCARSFEEFDVCGEQVFSRSPVNARFLAEQRVRARADAIAPPSNRNSSCNKKPKNTTATGSESDRSFMPGGGKTIPSPSAAAKKKRAEMSQSPPAGRSSRSPAQGKGPGGGQKSPTRASISELCSSRTNFAPPRTGNAALLPEEARNQAAIHLRHDEVHVCIPRTDLARAEGRRSNVTPIVVNERRNYLQSMEGLDRDDGDQGNENGNVSTSSDSVALDVLDITGRPSSGVDVADTFVRELLSTFFRNQMLRMAEGAGRIGNNAAAVTMRARAQEQLRQTTEGLYGPVPNADDSPAAGAPRGTSVGRPPRGGFAFDGTAFIDEQRWCIPVPQEHRGTTSTSGTVSSPSSAALANFSAGSTSGSASGAAVVEEVTGAGSRQARRRFSGPGGSAAASEQNIPLRIQHPNADIYSFRLDPTQHIVMAATETRLARVDYIVRDPAPAAARGAAGTDHELLIATGEPLPKNDVLPIGPTTIITELDLGTDLAPAGGANVVDDAALGNGAPANLHAGNFQNRIQQNYRADDAGGVGGLGLDSASSALQPAATGAAADPGRTTSEVAGAPAFTAAASAKKVARPTLLERGANLSSTRRRPANVRRRTQRLHSDPIAAIPRFVDFVDAVWTARPRALNLVEVITVWNRRQRRLDLARQRNEADAVLRGQIERREAMLAANVGASSTTRASGSAAPGMVGASAGSASSPSVSGFLSGLFSFGAAAGDGGEDVGEQGSSVHTTRVPASTSGTNRVRFFPDTSATAFVANAIARTPQQSDGVTRLPAGLSAQPVDRPSGAYMHEVSRQRRRSRPPPSDGSQPTLSAIPEVEVNVEAGDVDAGASASAGATDVAGGTASAAAADANSTTAVAERAAAASSSSSSSSSSSASDNAENAGEETPDEVAHELANGNQDGEETLAHQRAAMTSLAARFSRERKTPFMTPIAEPPSQIALFVMFWTVFFLHYGTPLLLWEFLYAYIYYATTPATDEQGDVDVAAAAYSDTMWIFLFLTLYYGRFVVRQLCTYLMTMLVLERGLRVERAVLRRRSSLHKELVMCGGEDEEQGVEYGTDGDETAAEGTALNLQVEDPFLTRGVDYQEVEGAGEQSNTTRAPPPRGADASASAAATISAPAGQDLLPAGNSTTAFDIFVAAQERASGYNPAAVDASHQSSSGTPFSIGFRFLSGLRVIAAQEFTSYLLGAVFLLYWVYGVEHCDELIYWLAAPALLETGLPALTVIGAALFLFAWFWTAYVWIVLLDLPAGQRLSGILSVAMVADHANKKRIEQEVLEKIPVVLYKDIVQTFPVAVQRQVLAGIEAEQGSAALGNSEAFRELQESVRAREQEQGLMQMKQDAAEPEASSDLLGKCSICYCEFGLEDYVIQSPCFQYHIFHPECITDWWKQSRLCPLCRTDIPEKITGRPYKPQHRWRNFTIRNTAAIDGGGEEGDA